MSEFFVPTQPLFSALTAVPLKDFSVTPRQLIPPFND